MTIPNRTDDKKIRNAIVVAGDMKNDGSFNVGLTINGCYYYLMTQRKSTAIYKALRPGVRIDELSRAYYENRKGRRSEEIKNSIKHILIVANDFLSYDYYEMTKEERNLDIERGVIVPINY